METITKYKADDGVEFFDKLDCIRHEEECVTAESIMSVLQPRQNDSDFDSDGYIQHDEATLLSVRNEYLEYCKRYTDHRWIQDTINGGFGIDTSYVARILDESVAPRSVSRLWWRFGCIDKQFREWQQPYYVKNTPENAKLIKRGK